MSLKINVGVLTSAQQAPAPHASSAPRKSESGQRGHVQPRAATIPLDQPGRLRACEVMGHLNVAHSTLYAGMRVGRYPKPDGYDGNRPYWNTATILDFLNAEAAHVTYMTELLGVAPAERKRRPSWQKFGAKSPSQV